MRDASCGKAVGWVVEKSGREEEIVDFWGEK